MSLPARPGPPGRSQKEPTYYDPANERKILLKKFSKDDLRFVLSQLDLEFEKQIGYDYGYIRDILDLGFIP